jgi:hypothetical protein
MNAPALTEAALNGKTVAEPSVLSVYQVVGIVIVLLIIGSVVTYSKDLFQFDIRGWLSANVYPSIPYLNGGATATTMEDETRSGPATLDYPNKVPVQPQVEGGDAATAAQTWCLVGEDMTGRWCVQVQGVKACDADRTFSSKNACEAGPQKP